jgi:hypothetical protein
MRKSAFVSLLMVALLLCATAPSDARGHGWHHHPGVRTRVFIGVGPAFWWGPAYPHWWGPPYPYWWYPPYYAYPPPPVILEQPPVYIQQPPLPAPAPPPQTYWYYCSSAKAYYPNVQTCAEPWVKVPPRPE